MRAPMGQDRLAGLTMVAVQSSRAQQVDTQTILKNYIQANPRRLFCHQSHLINWNSPSSQMNLPPACLVFFELLVPTVGF